MRIFKNKIDDFIKLKTIALKLNEFIFSYNQFTIKFLITSYEFMTSKMSTEFFTFCLISIVLVIIFYQQTILALLHFDDNG